MENLEIDENEAENEDYEPQVTSSNPTERKLARQLRIQRRLEALKKEKASHDVDLGDGPLSEFGDHEWNPIQQQIANSAEFLKKLIIEGDEYVSNVRIANEAREADRREREGFGKEKIIKELEEEAAAAEEMFHEIACKWSDILKYNDPLHINEDIVAQKDKCDELIRQKDGIIAMLKDKLKSAEINFSADQRKQMEDINALARRIENQITIMRKAYRRELELMEEVIAAERQALIDLNNKKWEDLAKRRDQEEQANSEKKEQDLEEFYETLKELRLDFQERFRESKIQMENDCNELQREFEIVKAMALMNGEKLDYNYQILKKREDENIIIRSQQKRRINKMQDVINSLRKKIDEYSTNTSTKISKVTAEINLLHKNILDIESKADYFAKANDNKFKQIWKMNLERANKLFQQIQDIDRTLHHQLLGSDWTPIETKRLSSLEAFKYRSVLNLLAELKGDKKPNHTNDKESAPGMDLQPVVFKSEEFLASETKAYKRVLKLIMQHISAKAEFLMEDQLKAILEPFTKEEQTLVRVDNVFMALDIRRREDIDLLLVYFLRYTYCPICSKEREDQSVTVAEKVIKVHEISSQSLVKESKHSSILSEQTDEFGLPSEVDESGLLGLATSDFAAAYINRDLEGECLGPVKTDEEQDMILSDRESDLEKIVMCQYQHPLVISPVYVLRALREFLGVYHVPKSSLPTMSARLSHQRNTVSRYIQESDIESYWKLFSEVFSLEREQLWTSLFEGLKKYHELLKARKNVSEDVVALRKQNLELRRLFANYLQDDM